MDKIHIRDLALRCTIGVTQRERRKKQDVVISVSLHLDLSRAGKTDEMGHTIDYRAVRRRIVRLVEDSRFRLAEALAEAVAEVCLGFAGVRQVEVTVEKPGALDSARTVGVEISRSSQDGVR